MPVPVGPFGPEDPETAIPKTPLPAQIPTRHTLEFTADESVGHIKPKMAGNSHRRRPSCGRPNQTQPSCRTLRLTAMRKAAEADPKVTALLGARWGFIDADRPAAGRQSLLRLLPKSGAIHQTDLLQLQPQRRDLRAHEGHGPCCRPRDTKAICLPKDRRMFSEGSS